MCKPLSPRYRITQTLLSAWLYIWKKDDGYEDFLRVLNREKTPPTKAMLDGVYFESLVNATLDGNPPTDDNKLKEQVEACADMLAGAQKQVVVFKDIEVNGLQITLHGVLDFLKEGVIYDTKFSKTYEVGKYLNSPQHPMYFALVPEAKRFEYVICDGAYVYTEDYERSDTQPIEGLIGQFIKFLQTYHLWDIYAEKWVINE